MYSILFRAKLKVMSYNKYNIFYGILFSAKFKGIRTRSEVLFIIIYNNIYIYYINTLKLLKALNNFQIYKYKIGKKI